MAIQNNTTTANFSSIKSFLSTKDQKLTDIINTALNKYTTENKQSLSTGVFDDTIFKILTSLQSLQLISEECYIINNISENTAENQTIVSDYAIVKPKVFKFIFNLPEILHKTTNSRERLYSQATSPLLTASTYDIPYASDLNTIVTKSVAEVEGKIAFFDRIKNDVGGVLSLFDKNNSSKPEHPLQDFQQDIDNLINNLPELNITFGGVQYTKMLLKECTISHDKQKNNKNAQIILTFQQNTTNSTNYKPIINNIDINNRLSKS